MPELHVSDARRRNMAAIRGWNTKPELVVRRFVHALGLRFRLQDRSLPGTPDLVLRRHDTVVFVHGCFWHHHGCANSVWPKTRPEFWREKILGNVSRDRRNEERLRAMGWRVVVIWECESKSPGVMRKRLQRLLRAKNLTVADTT